VLRMQILSAAIAGCLALSGGQAIAAPEGSVASQTTWTPDNGNGTFTNPLFYDEFSDPDLIRVGDYFYLTGTTMHAMPGLPILRSKDLVNWQFVAYALDKLDLGPSFRLEDDKTSYGSGIWAPSFRYHDGTFYIFSNVNGQKTQVFTATDPRGPWTQRAMKKSFHDLSVLFDEDGKAYVIWGYQSIHMAQLTPDLLDIVEGSEREIIPPSAGMGEGLHFYKLDGKYFIMSAWYAGRMRMPAARADNIRGPYEVNPAISTEEDFGLGEGYREKGATPPFTITPPDPAPNGHMSLHQGGIVQTPAGEWWGFSMMDYNSVGRLLSLSPITWKDGWPYFGLPGNLTRTPRTWIKPKTMTGAPEPVTVPFERNDDFSGAALQPLWQWNHVPVDGKWSLTERPGYLRLHSLPAPAFWNGRNSLTQRSVGPASTPTVVVDVSHLAKGDQAGLALLNQPYAWIGAVKGADGLVVRRFDQQTGRQIDVPVAASRLWFRADCDFLTEKAQFSYSPDGKTFMPLGEPFTMVFQLTTFQGVRYALFNYNSLGVEGGYADFDSFEVRQPHPYGLMRPIPLGENIQLVSAGEANGIGLAGRLLQAGAPATFNVVDMGLGRVALRSGTVYLTIAEAGEATLTDTSPGRQQSFQWIETPNGDLALMSLETNRFLRISPESSRIVADSPGPQSDGKDGVRFTWKRVQSPQ